MLIGQNTRNRVINGRMDYWQRGTSFATPASNSYTADRFKVNYDGTIGTFSVSRQAFALGQTDVPGRPVYFMRWDHTVAGSGSTQRLLSQPIESVRTLAGGKASVTFWAKADSARTLGVAFFQNFGTGGSPSAGVQVATQNASLTTSWQRFDLTFDIPSISGKTLGTNNNDLLLLEFFMPLNVVMTIDIASVMVVEGESAGDFELAGRDLPTELFLCRRYYTKSYRMGVFPAAATQEGIVHGSHTTSGSYSSLSVHFSAMRAVPAVLFYDANGNSNRVSWYSAGALAHTPNQLINNQYTSESVASIIASNITGQAAIVAAHYVADAEL
jgi:hypothetical protein